MSSRSMISVDPCRSDQSGGNTTMTLANKQDVPGAIDELDVVENLNVEYAANAMRSPTRVEICACIFPDNGKRKSTMGIIGGYKWLLDTVARNYSTLEHRIKQSQISLPVNNHPRPSIISMSSSRASIRSNPFKPINELVGNSNNVSANHANHVEMKTTRLKRFLMKNKTAPMPLGMPQTISRSVDMLNSSDIENTEPFNPHEDSDQVALVTLDPLNLFKQQINRPKQTRPFTAPAKTNGFTEFPQNIPGQVLQ